ncbi:MAG: CapA family protein [Muribaculaceae bacterium]|nr:CapA family protein [Muribaculaceae bacterium]
MANSALLAMLAICAKVMGVACEDHAPQATLLFAGDAMMHKSQLAAAQQPDGSYAFDECFAGLAPVISAADYAVVNLEGPLGGKPYAGYPCFCMPDSYGYALRDAGFDMLLTANNHTLDRNDRGLRRTVAMLDSIGVDHLGTYANPAERAEAIPYIVDVNGFKIGFLNYTYGTNGIKPQTDVVVDYIDPNIIKRDIAATRQAGAELVCVAIHWGIEYKLLPETSVKRLADELLAQDVDMVIGGHPHVIQPMEMRRRDDGRPQLLVYSLGNFISGMSKTDCRGGAMVEAYISRTPQGEAHVDSAAYRLVFTEQPTKSGQNFRVVEADSATTWLPQRDAFVASATRIFSAHNIDVPPLKK